MERECELLATEYARRGFRSVVITEQLGTLSPRVEKLGEITIHRVASSPTRSTFNQLRAAVGIARATMANRDRAALCIVRTFTLPAVVIGALKRLRLFKVPTIVTAETGGDHDDIVTLRRRRFARFLEFAIRGNDIFNGICSDNVQHLHALGYPPERITFIPNGVRVNDYQAVSAPDSVERFLFLGRIDREKGIVDLIEAFTRVRHSAISLTIVGEGPDESLVQAAITKSSLGDKITLSDRIHYEAVPALLSSHDCLVLPSYSEGLPLTILEAIVQKRVIIASSVGDLPALLGANSLCVPPGDVKELAKAISAAAAGTPNVDYSDIISKIDIRQTADSIALALGLDIRNLRH